jgi:hypothetical protein
MAHKPKPGCALRDPEPVIDWLMFNDLKDRYPHIATSTWRFWVKTGKVPAYQPTGKGGRLMFKSTEVHAFLTRPAG